MWPNEASIPTYVGPMYLVSLASIEDMYVCFKSLVIYTYVVEKRKMMMGIL